MKRSGTGTAIVSSYTLLEKLCQISLYVTDDVMFVKIEGIGRTFRYSYCDNSYCKIS